MKDSKNLVIGMLCAVLCIMAVAYAAFTTTLNINGTATVSSNWSIIIPEEDGIQCTTQAVAGGSTDGLSASGQVIGNTTAQFTMAFVQPGDTATCIVTIQNAGTLNAEVESLKIMSGSEDISTDGSDTAGPIRFTVQNITKGQKLAADGAEMTFTVIGTYDSSVTAQPDQNTTKTLTVTPIFKQDTSSGA